MQYIIGAYSQIPYGASNDEYEALVTRQLKPLLTMIYRNVNYKLLLNLGIAEFDYFENHHPELNMLINDLCRKGQVELLSNAYYDVVLSMIPTHERSSQVEKTTTYIRKHFSKKPKGLWLYNQVFNPTIVPMLSQTGLSYLVISTYNQLTGSIESTRPFYTDDLGKQALVFPTDDRFSALTQDLYKGSIDLEKYFSNVIKLAKDTTNALSTIMLNLDQLMGTELSCDVFRLLYENLGPNSTLPSIYSSSNEIARKHFLPNGIYGRDINLGKATSLNQMIYDNSMLCRHYCVVNMLKEVIRDSRRSIEDRASIENLLMKASSSRLYFPNEYRRALVMRSVNRHVCEIEVLLSRLENSILPMEVDTSFNKVMDLRFQGKSHIAYLSPKGAVLSRFIMCQNFYDLAFHSAEGLFADSFYNEYTSKELKLSSKPFTVTALDKKRNDFLAISPAISLGKATVVVKKRFKFRQATVIVEIEIENTSNESVENQNYECTLNLGLPLPCSVTCSDGAINNEEWAVTQNILVSDKSCPFNVHLVLSEQLHVERNDFYQKARTWLGDNSFYEYTQLKIQKTLSLGPMQSASFTIGLRTEKHKEKHNDTFEQSAP